MQFEIECLPKERETEREQCFDGFWVYEKAKLRYIGGQWSWKTEKYPQPWRKSYPIESASDEMERTVYICYDRGHRAGQITLCMWWNHFAYIDRLDVSEKYRRQGVATCLLQKAREWAKQQGARGLYLETQDTNVPAMRLYEKNGLKICGIDTMMYYTSPHRGETAIFYYELFGGELSSL